MTTSSAVRKLLDLIALSNAESFSGLGLIFYRPPLSLPVLPLGDVERFPYSLPVTGAKSIANVLMKTSNLDCPWHDGFHLIDIHDFALTHVSHFFSPPLAQQPSSSAPIGARKMAAILGSLLQSVDCIAILNSKKQTSIYSSGVCTYQSPENE